MRAIREKVLKFLSEFADEDDKLIDSLKNLVDDCGIDAYSVIIHVLTHLDLDPEEARHSWKNILSHRESLIKSLGRSVNLRTAICDYFCSVSKTMKSPIVVEIKVFEDKLKSIKYDSLTGLFSRGSFDETLAQEAARAERYETDLSLLFYDLDNFKQINDTYGHFAGDMALKKVAEIILKEIRAADFAARYGGEEIVVLLPKTGKVNALMLGDRIRKRIEETKLRHNGKSFNLTISGGLASYPIDAINLIELIQFADKALYRAKNSGKNKIVLHSPDKRRYVRLHFSTEFVVQKIGFEGHIGTVAVNCKDISRAGILIESKEPFEIGTKLQIQIPLKKGDENILILGTVVRIEAFGDEQYDIGVSFIEMKEELDHFISTRLEGLTTT
ncbi:MAG: diguanylate cyclase [Deltaproteobacteria bacterium]|nr:diguanylate cyclase [Deltaproteobacteria bacterium]